MAVVRHLVDFEDPLTAAARTAGDAMTPLRATYDELRIIADRRLGELGNDGLTQTGRHRDSRRSRWCRRRAASVG
jgi:hypothetical protein